MSPRPTPGESVPDFLQERFDEHSPETLREIAEHAAGEAFGRDVPEYAVHACVMQDEATKAEIAAYARALADHLDPTVPEQAGADH